MSLYKAIKAAGPDGRSVDVSGLKLERDAHSFSFNSGSLQFLTPVNGKTHGAVFSGSGIYTLAPASENERRQLVVSSLGKYDEKVSEPFESLLLLFTDNTFEEATAGKTVKTGEADTGLYEKFRKIQRKDLKCNLDMRMLAAMTNQGPARDGLFIAFIDSKKLPPAIAAVDPQGIGALHIYPASMRLGSESVGLFVSHERKGGFWYLNSSKQELASGAWKNPSLSQYADALHYKVSTNISGFENITGTTSIQFKALNGSLTALPIYLTASLKIESAKLLGEGDEVPDVKVVSDLDRMAIFSKPLVKDKEYTLELTYSGKRVLMDYGGVYTVGARNTWYPNLGTFTDKALYELQFDIPKNMRLAATGKLVEERKEKDRAISVWRSDAPLTVAGFNYGEYKATKQKEESTGMELAIFHGKATAGNMIHNVLADTVNSVRLYSSWFGNLPHSSISVTQQAELGFGQAWPSLVFLPYLAFVPNTSVMGKGANEFFNDLVTPHEMAHMWWGHEATARTYRDQWIEEGFSEFSAGLLLEMTQGVARSNEFWKTAGESITGKSPYGKLRVHEVGSITQGFRLATVSSREAYQVLAYSKGGYVLHMLRMMMRAPNDPNPDARFQAMLKEFINRYRQETVGTQDFKSVVERYMTPNMKQIGNGSMDWFFDQYVYGTQIPVYKSNFTVKKAGNGQYHIKGAVSQEGVSDDFKMIVPLYADFGKGNYVKFGAAPLVGNASYPLDVTMPIPQKPKRILVNAFYDVLSWPVK